MYFRSVELTPMAEAVGTTQLQSGDGQLANRQPTTFGGGSGRQRQNTSTYGADDADYGGGDQLSIGSNTAPATVAGLAEESSFHRPLGEPGA